MKKIVFNILKIVNIVLLVLYWSWLMLKVDYVIHTMI